MFHHKGKDHSTTSGLQAMATKINTDIVQEQIIKDAMHEQATQLQRNNVRTTASTEEKIMSEDEIDKLLEADDDAFSSNYRENRMDALKYEAMKSSTKIMRGEYIEINESEFIDLTTKNELVVIHF